MLRNWSGAGRGMITFFGLAHMLDVPCICTHVECYATGRSLGWGGMNTVLALAHMLNATQMVWGGMITFLAMLGWGGGDDNVPCTCTHVECYATGLGWGG